MVQSAVGAAAFNGNHVRGLFHHADGPDVPFLVPAGFAEGFRRAEKAADRTGRDTVRRLADGPGDGFRFSHVPLEHPQGHAFRAARADARQLLEGGDQFKHGQGIIQIIHEMKGGPVPALPGGATGWPAGLQFRRKAGRAQS